MEIKKYKPKIHEDIDDCTEDCEKDCNMECDICRATPWDINFYYIIEGENHNFQWCEKCFEELKKEARGDECKRVERGDKFKSDGEKKPS